MTSKPIVSVCISVLVASILLADNKPATALTMPVRVGTFDRKVLVIAYDGSEFNERALRDLAARHKEAKAAGDQKLIVELEKQGEAKQELAHKQVAGEASIVLITAELKSAWPDIAAAAKVDVILLEPPLYGRAGVEVIDVTNALVERINPNERARGFIRDLKKGKQP